MPAGSFHWVTTKKKKNLNLNLLTMASTVVSPKDTTKYLLTCFKAFVLEKSTHSV